MTDALLHLQRRMRRKVTQLEVGQAVAVMLGRGEITSAVVSRYFTGKREMDLVEIAAYAKVLGVDPGWLAFGTDSEAPAPEGWTPPVTSEERDRAYDLANRLQAVVQEEVEKGKKADGQDDQSGPRTA